MITKKYERLPERQQQSMTDTITLTHHKHCNSLAPHLSDAEKSPFLPAASPT